MGPEAQFSRCHRARRRRRVRLSLYTLLRETADAPPLLDHVQLDACFDYTPAQRYDDVNLDAYDAYDERAARVAELLDGLAAAARAAAAANHLLPRRDSRPERVARLLQRACSAASHAGARRLAARACAAGDGARVQ